MCVCMVCLKSCMLYIMHLSAGEDYDSIDFEGIGGNNLDRNVINYKGGDQQTVSQSFTVTIRSDSDEEPPEDFFVLVSPVRTTVVLTPRVSVTICGGIALTS